MNDIIGGLKDKNEFPEWYEGLHKALFRAHEFLGKQILFSKSYTLINSLSYR